MTAEEIDVAGLTTAERCLLWDSQHEAEALVKAVERIIAERVQVAEAERDRARLSRDAAKTAIVRQIRARKSAEAALAELRAGVEALAAKWHEAAGTDRDNESRALRKSAAGAILAAGSGS